MKEAREVAIIAMLAEGGMVGGANPTTKKALFFMFL
jgi:hypothetical protein